VEAYCVKCKVKREVAGPVAVFTAGGTAATRGTCPVCQTTLFRMGRTPAHEGLEPPPVADRPARRARRAKPHGKLVIVESPTKAKTVGRFLGKEYTVRASVGHVRDLLRSQLSVDVEKDFEPKYRVPNEKRQIVKALKAEAERAEQLFLATDLDREGEAIAWHLLQAMEVEPSQAKRVVFHEITRPAIEQAFKHPRKIDAHLVDAQQARRILDRLVGYSLSPLLWSKVRSRLSAGRVQSAALRLVVDRERAIEGFQAREYWTVDASLLHPSKPPAFWARLTRLDGVEPGLGDEVSAQDALAGLRRSEFVVAKAASGSRSRRPLPPFTTSTLQQDASRRLGYTARRTMALAQQLYEGIDIGQEGSVGLITYMRTDSTHVATDAQHEARKAIEARFGPRYIPPAPPVYRTRTRGAQEAHEAIRPTDPARDPDGVRANLTTEQYKLYSLIWKRFLASQMAPAEYDTRAIDVKGRGERHSYELKASASALRFPGFLDIYEDRPSEGGDNGEEEPQETLLAQLPDLERGDHLELKDLKSEQHFTQPPPRFSEASLVKALEENGIGRPSTYAPILSTLQERGYVQREAKRLYPTEIGATVNDLLVEHFPNIVDLGFTARMEGELDDVASGSRRWTEVVREFYTPFAAQVKQAALDMPEVKTEPEVLERACPRCGKPLVVRYGRYGKFIGCSDFPTCRHTEPWLEKIGVACPKDGGEVIERRTRKGRTFYGCENYPACDFTSWKRPLPGECSNCGGLLVVENRTHAVCIACGSRYERSAVVPTEEPA
jgi:DNA topoisomerase I